MRRNLLITTAAAAILAATGLATAQDRGGNQGGAMEKAQPQGQMQRGQRGQAQTPENRGTPSMNETRGQAPDAQKNQKQPSGAAERPAKNKSMQKSEGARPADKNMQKSDTDRRPGTRQSEGAKQQDNQKSGARNRTETTGRGDASGANLTTEQRTKIRQVVVSKKIPKVTNVNFTVSVGARVPQTVRFHPIPTEIVTIYPAWRGYRVILVGSELVIVHPRSYEIVAVLVV